DPVRGATSSAVTQTTVTQNSAHAHPTKDAARAEVFDYIEMFYNPNRRHGSTGDLSPVEFERRYAQRGS
ncbi:IS3 family transposase, partial [Xanthomonas phaseoli]